MTPLISAAGLSIFRGTRPVLTNVQFDLRAGEFVALLGLNGAGKSTLLETVVGILDGYTGQCCIREKEVRDHNRRELSREASFLPQWQPGASGFTVRQVVAMGRYSHSSNWTESPDDRHAIESSLAECRCDSLATRPFQTLSGGERQRVLLAATLAQQAPILALDEPSAHADPPLQATLFGLLRDRANKGSLCIAAVHDINLAVAFATRAILLHNSGIVYDGNVEGLLQSQAFSTVFGPEITVVQDTSGRNFVAYSRRPNT